jgi:hypothetical protein
VQYIQEEMTLMMVMVMMVVMVGMLAGAEAFIWPVDDILQPSQTLTFSER